MAASNAAAKAAEAEAKLDELSVDFKGETYKLPPTIEMLPVDVLESFEDGKWVSFVRGVMGEEQWSSFKDSGPTIKDLGALAEKIDAAYATVDGGS